MLGCFNPNLGQIWTNPNFGLKSNLKMYSFILPTLTSRITEGENRHYKKNLKQTRSP